MVTFKLDKKKFEKSIKELQKKAPEKLQSVLLAGGDAVVLHAKNQASVDIGGLRASIIKTPNFTKNLSVVKIVASAPYAAHVEYGTSPHTSARGHDDFVASIKRWCERHGIENWYGVYRKIVMRGTKARPFFVPAFNKVAPKVYQRIKKEVADLKL